MKLRSVLLLLVPGLLAGTAYAQDYIYTNNDVSPGNTTSGYLLDKGSGSLTPVPGSPVATGGAGTGGGFFASVRATTATADGCLFISNGGTENISAFAIDPADGSLTSAGVFPTGGVSGPFGITLAATPDGQFLYAGSPVTNNIRGYNINGDCSLTAIAPLFAVGGLTDGIKISPNGKWLYTALVDVGEHGAVAARAIMSDGSLVPVPGSPFPARAPGGDPGSGTGIDIDCTSSFMFVSEAKAAPAGTTTVDMFAIDSGSGALTNLGTFAPGMGLNSNVVVLSNDDTLAFISNQSYAAPGPGSVTVAFHDGAGGLTYSETDLLPVGHYFTSGLATDSLGADLVTASFPNWLDVFSNNGDGTLTYLGGVTTGQPMGLLSLTAFPGKSCSSLGR